MDPTPVFLDLDSSKPTFESLFHPIEDFNVPFETGYYTIRQLAMVKQRTYGKLFSKVNPLCRLLIVTRCFSSSSTTTSPRIESSASKILRSIVLFK